VITQRRLRELIYYDPVTGIITCIKARRSKVRPGQIHGSKMKSGYIEMRIDGVRGLAHRFAWFYMYGVWPKEIDHINGDKSDNRRINLRDVSRTINNANSHKLRKKNKSGVRGVSWFSRDGLWRATIYINKRAKNLGHFKTIEEAAKARRDAELNVYGGLA
jgi:hypothetical protein